MESYGVVVVALQIMSYLPLLDGGFRTAVNRRILADESKEERGDLLYFCQVLYSWLALIIFLVGVVAMGVYLLTPNARNSGQPMIFFLVLGVSGALTVITAAQGGVLVGLGMQANLFFINALNAWISTTALWLSLREGAGVWAFPISTLMGICGTYPIILWMVRRRERSIRFWIFNVDERFWKCFRRLKWDAWACFRSQGSIMLLFSLDLVLVGFLCSAQDAAIYGVLSRLFGIVRSFLQTFGEVAWPIMAQRKETGGEFSSFLLRLNGWLYGSVMGAIAVTLIPFIQWFMGNSWRPPEWLVYLLVVRFLISGLSSPAAYFLIGLGDFRSIARCVERELLAALILGVLLGRLWGIGGVASAFCIATIFGTLAPIMFIYAGREKISPIRLMSQVWWRALVGFGTSFLVAARLIYMGGNRIEIVAIGLGSAVLALCLGVCISYMRLREKRPFLWRARLIDLVNKI